MKSLMKRPVTELVRNMTAQQWNQVFKGFILFALVFTAYSPVINGEFVWDDYGLLVENANMAADDGLSRFWFSSSAPDYYPITWSSLWIEYRVWGNNPAGYRVTNLVLHALGAVLFWQVLKMLKVPGGWIAGLIFAVHPVCVESVAWVVERKNVLSLVFYLLTVMMFVKYRESLSRTHYIWALALFAAALLSKTSVVMLPLILSGIVLWKEHRLSREALRQIAPFFVLAILFGMVTVWFQQNNAIGGENVRPEDFASRLAGSAWMIWFYAYKAVFPIGLCAIYPRWSIDASTSAAWVPLISIAAAFSVFWNYRKSWGGPVLAALGYYILTLLPLLGFVQMYPHKFTLTADRWQYLALLGPVALAARGAARILRKQTPERQTAGAVCATAVVVVLSVLTAQRAAEWRNEEALWKANLRRNPSCLTSMGNLASWLHKKGRYEEALCFCREMLKKDPDRADANYITGLVETETGDLEQAAEHYRKTLKQDPDYEGANYNLGLVYYRMGQLERAERYYRLETGFRPRFARAHTNLGLVLSKTGSMDKAAEHCRKAVEIRPSFALAQNNMGVVLSRQGRVEEAIPYYTEAVRLEPENTDFSRNLLRAMYLTGRIDIKKNGEEN